MKNIVSLLVIFTFFGCGRCDHCDQQPVDYEYSIQNNSGAKAEIVPYHFNSSGTEQVSLADKITLEDSKMYTKKYRDGAPYDGFSFNVMLKYPSKIDVVFNNSKKITYTTCDSPNGCSDPRNIFGQEFNNDIKETYTITAADFQNAAACNGNCY